VLRRMLDCTPTKISKDFAKEFVKKSDFTHFFTVWTELIQNDQRVHNQRPSLVWEV